MEELENSLIEFLSQSQASIPGLKHCEVTSMSELKKPLSIQINSERINVTAIVFVEAYPDRIIDNEAIIEWVSGRCQKWLSNQTVSVVINLNNQILEYYSVT